MFRHSNISAPSAKADGKDKEVNTNIFFSVFLFPLPSALADGAEISEYLTGNKYAFKSSFMKFYDCLPALQQVPYSLGIKPYVTDLKAFYV